MSNKVTIRFNESERNAFDHLRNIFASEDVILTHPDFKLLIDLTTESQNNRLITMISVLYTL